MAKIAIKKKVMKKAAPKKKAKKVLKKAAKSVKKAPAPVEAPKPITKDSNGDPIGAVGVSATGTEIDTSKGAVSVKAKKTAAESTPEKKNYSVVMRGGVPTKVEDDGDEQ